MYYRYMAMYTIVIVILLAAVHAENLQRTLSDEFINEINDLQSHWEAGRNFPKDLPHHHLKRLAGTLPSKQRLENNPARKNSIPSAHLPQNFNAFEKWPYCNSITEVPNQGYCGSCWAVSAASVISDRICINTTGADQFYASAQDITSCAIPQGCDGGEVENAWNYYISEGVVSGGPYGSNGSCWPYEVSAPKKTRDYDPEKYITPSCVDYCKGNQDLVFRDDKKYGTNYRFLSGENDIMNEIFHSGPVQLTFQVFEDFYHYKSGIYYHVTGKLTSHHAVKAIGWGVENGHKYWLISNSWGTNWGNLNGFFKIRRGNNECRIEVNAATGYPLVLWN